MDAPLLEITSHVDGKNAKVRVYTDRVEWERPKHLSGGKIAAGVMTGGMSLLATGINTRKGSGVEVIPMRQITSVTQKRDTMLNDVVSVITSGNSIDLRCSRAEAGQLRAAILGCINGTTAPAPAPTPSAPPAAWYPDPQNPSLNRWWDGARWTEHSQAR